jgi:hypothetical protein
MFVPRRKYTHVSISKDNPFYCMTSKGSISEQRLVMAMYLGRPLTHKELVHHKDNNPSNNSILNLFLTNEKDHSNITYRHSLRKTIRTLTDRIQFDKKRIIEIGAELDKLYNDNKELFDRVDSSAIQ